MDNNKMTEQEYEYGLKAIQDRYEAEKNAHKKLYADSQRMFNVGDIIQNDRRIIKIERFKWSNNFGGKYPVPVYVGTELTKKLQPKKIGDGNGVIYGNDGVEKIS